MSIESDIEQIFNDYLGRRGVKKKVAALIQVLQPSHVPLLLHRVRVIGDPMHYANEAQTSAPVEQFFAFIDLVSALVLVLGPEAIEQVAACDDRGSQYLPWVKKFVLDERFHGQVMAQIPASAIKAGADPAG